MCKRAQGSRLVSITRRVQFPHKCIRYTFERLALSAKAEVFLRRVRSSKKNYFSGTIFYMKTLLKVLAVLLVANTLLGCSTFFDRSSVSVKRLIWLEREGIFDPEVPTSEVHALLTKGLYHKDPEIVACSVGAIALYAFDSFLVAVDTNHDVLDLAEVQSQLDRQLAELPGIYDLFTGLWDEGWTKSGGIVPKYDPYTKLFVERPKNETDCIMSDQDPVWVELLYPLVLMFPADEKVHEIIWRQMPQDDPDDLLTLLRLGNFDTSKNQQHRIDILTNPETNEVTATLAAESLGEFRSDDSLDTLVRVLRSDVHGYISTTMTIVASIMQYKEDGVPHIALMRQNLDSVSTDSTTYRGRKEQLQERLDWFEEHYSEKLSTPTN